MIIIGVALGVFIVVFCATWLFLRLLRGPARVVPLREPPYMVGCAPFVRWPVREADEADCEEENGVDFDDRDD